jgi:hypothetical protein
MKILVDKAELNEVFYIVGTVKNSIHTLPLEYVKTKLQEVCDILEPQLIQPDWEIRIDNEKIKYATLMD